MENSKIIVCSGVSKNYKADLTIVLVVQKKKDTPNLENIDCISVQNSYKHGDFKGTEKDIFIDYSETSSQTHKSIRTAYVGLGQFNKKQSLINREESLRLAGGLIARTCKKVNAKKICIIPPLDVKIKEKDLIYSLTEGILLGDYIFDKYKTVSKKKKNNYSGIKELRFIAKNTSIAILRKTVSEAKKVADSVFHARNMANEPGSNWTPDSFAEYSFELEKKYKLACRVLEKKELEKLGMNGILAVNKGSEIPPKLIIVEHIVSKKAKTLLLVGKGLTFDSGGISLKPAAGMDEMKFDMCGGAAVLAAMNWVGENKPKCNVVAIVPATDNMSGGSALKPGDIVVHYNKMTSEIINTDAEGRLILADSLAYGIEKYSPDYVIDLATLTGAVIIGLGHHYTGLMSNNDDLAEKILKAGSRTGEPAWRLPLGPEYIKQIDSKIADMKNTGGRAAGTITAAEYLHKFVGKTAWAHLDIAGTAWGYTEKTYIPESGASGVSVRTLIEFIRDSE